MRVGAVTHRGYGQLVLERFGAVWGWFAAGDLVLTNLVTLIAEFVAIRVGLAYFHLGAGVAALLGVLLVAFTLSGGRYWRWERIVLGLAVFNGLFLLAALFVASLGRRDRARSGHVVAVPGGSFNTLLLLVASTIGATVTPWMIFFQQSASADKGMTPDDLRHGRYRHGARRRAGRACSAAERWWPGAALATHGGASHPGSGRRRASRARWTTSRAGPSGTLFALGLIEAGAVAVLTISASTGYAVSECIGAPHSMNSSLRGAAVFYGVQPARRAARRRDHPHPRRAAAVDRAQRQRAGHGAAARVARVRGHAGQRPHAHGPLGQQR